MARPTALAPLGTIIRGLGATLEGIGAGIADTFSREKCLALLPLLSYAPVLPLCNCTDTYTSRFVLHSSSYVHTSSYACRAGKSAVMHEGRPACSSISSPLCCSQLEARDFQQLC